MSEYQELTGKTVEEAERITKEDVVDALDGARRASVLELPTMVSLTAAEGEAPRDSSGAASLRIRSA